MLYNLIFCLRVTLLGRLLKILQPATPHLSNQEAATATGRMQQSCAISVAGLRHRKLVNTQCLATPARFPTVRIPNAGNQGLMDMQKQREYFY